MHTDNHIEIKDLHFYRGDRAIFSGVSLSIPRGKVTAIMGPSGTGKTTLLKIIGGEIRPHAGEVLVGGIDVFKLSRVELLELRRDMGMLFQSSALFTDLTLFENVAFPIRVHTDLPEDSIRDLVLLKLNAVGLRGARDLMPNQLSGGMARRAALARAMALDPGLLMYDEPFTGQDPISMGVVVSLIKAINTSLGSTSLIVSHDIHETSSIADQIFLLGEGKLMGSGSPDELRAHPSPNVQQFMHGAPDGPVPFHYPADDLRYDMLGGVS